jgi:AhpD family alkylhydroperoxidase
MVGHWEAAAAHSDEEARSGLLRVYPRGYTCSGTHAAHGKEVLDQLSPLQRQLRQKIPDAYKTFQALYQASFAPGALDVKTKELIAFAIGVTEQCDGCIAAHAQSAAHAGATREEAAEAIGVTFLMKGGPATIYGPRAYAAFCEFKDALDTPGAVP